ncbi:Rhodanese-like domain-containing protein [Pyronema domesticum]|uniref:Similar to Putative thiosulfate sulfurtransferase, mitochondrial acc. no. Q10215 n=1 Tax=Pyronema omphalodes (strain CBS 100304) TaxID=1076935 RepID=U4KWH9_PYROM|nr:Rhodanese-like domain-containing protein [Pyronema domesticum]CCX05842.1 Similar to Putative thiosulfate sulfurtransferase, mitochondrial; acc. no. Q10215 [Pyronema omphalodes CBS 100304]
MSFRHALRIARPLVRVAVSKPTITNPIVPTIRNFTTSQRLSTTKRYNFASLQSLPSSSILIDVREPSEFQAGAIPGALNLPITSAPEALCLPEDEFVDRFGFAKPPKDAEVVFYCKAGVRSAAAAQLALQMGYEKVAEYPGSWVDWVKRTNEAAGEGKKA